MTRYVVRRTITSLALIWLTATALFFFIHVLPGDPAEVILGSSETRQPTPAQLDRVREQLGLNRPVLAQYADYMTGLVRGDLGDSFLTGRPVATELRLRLVRSLQLIIPAIVLSSLLGIGIGVVAARRRGGWQDGTLSAVGLVGHSLPAFVTGNLLVLLLAIQLSWLPSSGFVEFSEDPRGFLTYIALPIATLTLGGIGPVMRMTRMTMVEQLSQDYARTAHAKGLAERTVTYRHVLRNALLPVMTVIGLQVGSRFAGAVLVETIFNWPGLSTLLLSAVNNRDYPIIQGTILLTSTIFIFVNMVTDLFYAVLDPRIRYT
jgi:peptide/nickel transport system permease protein